jgi:threonine/homoserine/homoserine lactone efflux protein
VSVFGTTDLAVFIVSGLLLNITPGQDTLYILGRSTTQGARAGCVAALAIGAGCLVHTCAAALGLSALLMASSTAFAIVKWLGAAYLVWMGIDLLRERAAPANVPTENMTGRQHAPTLNMSYRRIFAQGFLTNVLNPKVALFFVAFLPQFVAVDAPNKMLAFLFLGIVFDVNGTAWNLLVAWTAGRASTRIAPRARRWANRVLGGALVFVGVRLAASRLG